MCPEKSETFTGPSVINVICKFSWSTHWFKVTAQIPNDWNGEEVHFRWNSDSEAMVSSTYCPVLLLGCTCEKRKCILVPPGKHGYVTLVGGIGGG